MSVPPSPLPLPLFYFLLLSHLKSRRDASSPHLMISHPLPYQVVCMGGPPMSLQSAGAGHFSQVWSRVDAGRRAHCRCRSDLRRRFFLAATLALGKRPSERISSFPSATSTRTDPHAAERDPKSSRESFPHQLCTLLSLSWCKGKGSKGNVRGPSVQCKGSKKGPMRFELSDSAFSLSCRFHLALLREFLGLTLIKMLAPPPLLPPSLSRRYACLLARPACVSSLRSPSMGSLGIDAVECDSVGLRSQQVRLLPLHCPRAFFGLAGG